MVEARPPSYGLEGEAVKCLHILRTFPLRGGKGRGEILHAHDVRLSTIAEPEQTASLSNLLSSEILSAC